MAVSESRVIDGVVRATWDDDLEQYREFATAYDGGYFGERVP